MLNPRICTTCNLSKPITEFWRSPNGRDGYLTKCKQCKSLQRNRERERGYNKTYHHANKTRMNARSREWHKKNPEQSKIITQRYRQTEKARDTHRKCSGRYYERLRTQDPERYKFRNVQMVQRRRARIRNQLGAKFTFEQWQAKILALGAKCVYCHQPFDDTRTPTQDHVIPLASGGMHELANIVPACQTCNVRKNTKSVDEFVSTISEHQPPPTDPCQDPVKPFLIKVTQHAC